MRLTIKNTTVAEEEVDVQLPLYWRLDNWFSKLEENVYHTIDDVEIQAIQLTSVTGNCISKTLMTLVHFQSYYDHYRGLYDEITEQEFVTEFDKLANYLK